MPGGKQLEHGLRGRRHLRERGADVGALLEEDLDDAVAVERLRLDVLDVCNLRGQVAFVEVDDAAGHVVRQQPGIGPDDTDHRNVDIGKDVGGSPQRRQRAEDGNEKGEYDKRIRPPERDLNDPHGSSLLQTRKGRRESGRSRRRLRNLSESRGRVTGATDAALRGKGRIEPNRRAHDYVERGRCCQRVEGGTGVQAEDDWAGGRRPRLDARVTGCWSSPRRC